MILDYVAFVVSYALWLPGVAILNNWWVINFLMVFRKRCGIWGAYWANLYQFDTVSTLFLHSWMVSKSPMSLSCTTPEGQSELSTYSYQVNIIFTSGLQRCRSCVNVTSTSMGWTIDSLIFGSFQFQPQQLYLLSADGFFQIDIFVYVHFFKKWNLCPMLAYVQVC